MVFEWYSRGRGFDARIGLRIDNRLVLSRYGYLHAQVLNSAVAPFPQCDARRGFAIRLLRYQLCLRFLQRVRPCLRAVFVVRQVPSIRVVPPSALYAPYGWTSWRYVSISQPKSKVFWNTRLNPVIRINDFSLAICVRP